MKLLLLLVVPIICFSQDIPKHSPGIVLKSTAADSLLFERAVNLFDNAGYIVIRADDKRGKIITDKRIVSGIMAMRILADVHNGVVTIRGQWFTNYHDYITYVNDNINVIYRPTGGNEKKCFLALVELAETLRRQFPGTQLSYLPATD